MTRLPSAAFVWPTFCVTVVIAWAFLEVFG